jgi:hypothetical protein
MAMTWQRQAAFVKHRIPVFCDPRNNWCQRHFGTVHNILMAADPSSEIATRHPDLEFSPGHPPKRWATLVGIWNKLEAKRESSPIPKKFHVAHSVLDAFRSLLRNSVLVNCPLAINWFFASDGRSDHLIGNPCQMVTPSSSMAWENALKQNSSKMLYLELPTGTLSSRSFCASSCVIGGHIVPQPPGCLCFL